MEKHRGSDPGRGVSPRIESQSADGAGTGVALEPGGETLEPGETATFDVVVETPSEGVGSYGFDVATTDASVLVVEDVSLNGDPSLGSPDVADDGSSATVSAASLANTDVSTLATVTVTATDGGSVTLSLSDVQVGYGDGSDDYAIESTGSASVDVREGPEADVALVGFDPRRSATAGDDVTVRFTIENSGSAPGDATLEYVLTDAGFGVLSESFVVENVQPDGSRTVTRTVSTDGLASGDYTHELTLDGSTRTAPLGLAPGSGFIRGTVRDEANVPVEGATVAVRDATGTVVAETTTDPEGEYTLEVPALGPDTPYTVTFTREGFQAFQTPGVTVDAPNEVSTVDAVLVRLDLVANLEVEPRTPTTVTGGTQQFTVTVTDQDLGGSDEADPVEGVPVDARAITATDVAFVGPTTATTNADGEVTFRVTADAVATATLNFSTSLGLQPGVETTVSFVRDGDGVVEGRVIDARTGTPIRGASVYAVRDGRFDANTFTNAGFGSIDVGALDDDDTIFVRLVDNETGQIIDNEEYRIQVPNANDTAVRKIEELNTSNPAVGEGFAVIDANGDGDVTFEHTRLAPDEYYAEISADAGNSSQDQIDDDQTENFAIRAPGPNSTFSPTTNLTLAATEERATASGANLVDALGFENSFGVLTQGTNEFGNFKLNKLFTDFQSGREYVVVVQDAGQTDVDFADVEAFENGAPEEEQFFYQFDLLPEEPEAANVDLQQVGTVNSVGDQIDTFDNQSDPFAQNVSRDGTIDVFDVTTTTAAQQPINGTVIVEVEDNDSSVDLSFDGEFVDAQGGQIVGTSEDRVRVTTNDDNGTVRLFLRSDNKSSNLLTNKTATLANDLSERDSSRVRFVGVVAFQSASISGIVTDSDDTPIPDSAVWASQFDFGTDADPSTAGVQESNRFVIEPDTTAQPGTVGSPSADYADAVDDDSDEFVVIRQTGVFNNSSGEFRYQTVATDVATAAELRNYTFDEFAGISVAQTGGADTEFKLYDRAIDSEDASYTLDPVPAVAQGDLETNYLTSAVKFGETPTDAQGIRANPGRASVLPGTTDDANIVFPTDLPETNATGGPQVEVTSLSAPSEAEPGDTITVNATVENTGDLASESLPVAFRLDTNGNDQLDDTETLATMEAPSLEPGETSSLTFSINTSGVPNGTYTHGVVVENQPGAADDSVATAEITIGNATPSNGDNNTTNLGTDIDGDGLREDFNDNGELDFLDVVTLLDNLGTPEFQDNASDYDFAENDGFSFLDVVALLEELNAQDG